MVAVQGILVHDRGKLGFETAVPTRTRDADGVARTVRAARAVTRHCKEERHWTDRVRVSSSWPGGPLPFPLSHRLCLRGEALLCQVLERLVLVDACT